MKNARQLYEAATPVWSSFSAANSSAECTTCRHRVQLASGCLPRISLMKKTALVLSAETSQTQDTLEGNTTDTLNTTASDINNAQTSQTQDTLEGNTNTTDTLNTTVTDSNSAQQTSQTQDGPHSGTPESTINITDAHDNMVDDNTYNLEHNNDMSVNVCPNPVHTSTPIKRRRPQTVDTSTSPMIKKDITFSHSFSKSHNQPLTKDEEKLCTHLIKRKLYSDPHKQVIKCKTKGQPLVLQRIIAPRKHSNSVRTPTKRKRAHLLHDTRSYVAGTSHQSADTQLASELKLVPQTRRSTICKTAGVKETMKVSKEHTLVMKEALALSWRQGRKQGQLLKEVGIQLGNEKTGNILGI